MRTLKYAWRFLMRSKSYTIINLLGLAFSLACSIILIRYIHRELTVDAHSVDPEHIIIPLRDMEGNIHPGSLQQDWTEADSVYILDHQIVEQCRLMLQQRDNVVYENSNYAMNIAAVDSTFFHFFHYPIVAGEASLEAPNDAIITQHYARNIFGKENPIGKVLEYYGKNITIKGVIGELDCKSLLQFDILVSYRLIERWQRMDISLMRILPGVKSRQNKQNQQCVQKKIKEETEYVGSLLLGKIYTGKIPSVTMTITIPLCNSGTVRTCIFFQE